MLQPLSQGLVFSVQYKYSNSNRHMKPYGLLLLMLCAIKLSIHGIGNWNYGFHRDELLHLSVGQALDWGYMEFPPMIALLGRLGSSLFGFSLGGIRLLPTLAGMGILLLACSIARLMGGKRASVFLCGMAVLSFLPYYRNHTLFQPVAFDQFFWVLGFYFLARYFKNEGPRNLLFWGISLGLGMMNKYTMAVWALGVFIGLFFYRKGKVWRSLEWYIGGLIALIMVLPNVLWQAQHGFPEWLHLKLLRENQLQGITAWDFLAGQFVYPLTTTLALIGLLALLLYKPLRNFRALGVSVLSILTFMAALHSRDYYIFGAYPVLFAAGSVWIEKQIPQAPVWNYAIAGLLFIWILPDLPRAIPILPIQDYIHYRGLEKVEGRYELTSDYADMFGWEEQVALVDSVYQSLRPDEKKNCVIWAENYGEAGALKILGKKYGLPDPISRHGSFWLWGYQSSDAAVWISLGNERPSVEFVFEDIQLVKMITHPYAIGEENNIPLYICRKPKIDIAAWWAGYETHVFD